MDISSLSLDELIQLQKQIPAEIKAREHAAKQKALNEVAEFAKARGFSLDELVGSVRKEGGSPRANTRKPAQIKYRHPVQTDLTWTGRGRQPKWVATWIAEGKTIGALAV
ncbi:MAG: H-NS histone family protein [Sterolibacterium sp.]|nr:H-NS histone family protein [Sterolibacterium sp.]